MAQQFVSDFITKLSNTVNNFSCDDKGLSVEIAELISQDHRTLQQSMVKVLFNALVEYGEIARSDGRNECAVKVCQEMKKIDNYFPLI